MKKITCLITCLIMILSALSGSLLTVSANSPTRTYEICGDYAYTLLSDKTVRIEGYNGTEKIIEVPTSLDGHKVTSLGRFAFYGCETLESITIHHSITSIDDSSFDKCYELSEIKIDSDNKVYDSRENCNAIIESKTNKLISGCKDTVIPNSVTSIGSGAFTGCVGLTSITIPKGTTSIGGAAFHWCENLTSVTISDTVTNIEDSIFAECVNLSEIKVDSNNRVYDSRENCNAIIKTETDTLLFGCMNTVIPDDVTSIAEDAFYCCEKLTSITIPDSVHSIGESAFSGCTSLESIAFPDSRAFDIGDYAFHNCDAITSVTIPENVKDIGYNIFSNCDNLSKIKVDDNNEVYDSRENCNAIIETKSNSLICGCMNTIIPDNVVCIDDGAFGSCKTLTSITIPDSVVAIGDDAFNGCEALESITIPESVKSIGEYAFGMSYDDDKVHIYVYEGSYAHEYVESEKLDFEVIVSDDYNEKDAGNEQDVETESNKKTVGVSAIVLIIALCVSVPIIFAIVLVCVLVLIKKRKR